MSIKDLSDSFPFSQSRIIPAAVCVVPITAIALAAIGLVSSGAHFGGIVSFTPLIGFSVFALILDLIWITNQNKQPEPPEETLPEPPSPMAPEVRKRDSGSVSNDPVIFDVEVWKKLKFPIYDAPPIDPAHLEFHEKKFLRLTGESATRLTIPKGLNLEILRNIIVENGLKDNTNFHDVLEKAIKEEGDPSVGETYNLLISDRPIKGIQGLNSESLKESVNDLGFAVPSFLELLTLFVVTSQSNPDYNDRSKTQISRDVVHDGDLSGYEDFLSQHLAIRGGSPALVDPFAQSPNYGVGACYKL